MRISGTDARTNAFYIGQDIQAVQAGQGLQEVPGEALPVSAQPNATDYPITEKKVNGAVEKLNRMFEGTSRKFEYSVHEKTNTIIIRVIDEITNEVIREIPPQKILDMVACMMEMAGLIVDERR